MDNKQIEKGRMNIYLVKELKDYIDTEARNYGISTSAYMTMIIQNWRMQNNAMSTLNDIKELQDKFNFLQQLSK